MTAPSSSVKQFDWSHLYENARAFHENPLVLPAVPVVKGFQRGSKELGCPTANLSMEELGAVGEGLDTGIYYGIATLNGKAYPAVVSVGWNPFYKNVKKTVEAHLLEELADFYGEPLQVSFLGYLRQEANFNGLDELISCIASDIEQTRTRLAATHNNAVSKL